MNRLVEKFTSGQWILTVVVGFTYAYCAVKSIITPETIASVSAMVFALYFRRDRKSNGTTTDADSPP